MKTSITKFVTIFLLTAFAFQFISNSFLGDKIALFPDNGEWYPGSGSPVVWKDTMATIIYPVKYILVEPLSFLALEPDYPPPVLLVAFGLYWAAMAWGLHFIINRIFRKKVSPQ